MLSNLLSTTALSDYVIRHMVPQEIHAESWSCLSADFFYDNEWLPEMSAPTNG